MDKIENSFFMIKNEINLIKEEISKINTFLVEIGNAFCKLDQKLKNLEEEKEEIKTKKNLNETLPGKIETGNLAFSPQKGKNLDISIGNGGVKTDRQTDRQTDGTQKDTVFPQEAIKTNEKVSLFQSAIEVLSSLDSIKKEIRLKFKRLTKQEFAVFSAIYLLEEEKGFSDYKSLSKKLNLSESVLRDYVQRLILKEIPVEKRKINNKEIHLFISPDIKKVASLDVIFNLIQI